MFELKKTSIHTVNMYVRATQSRDMCKSYWLTTVCYSGVEQFHRTLINKRHTLPAKNVTKGGCCGHTGTSVVTSTNVREILVKIPR